MPPSTTMCRCWSAPGAIAPTGGLDGRRAPRLSMSARVPAPPPCAALSARSAWGMLLALSCGFALSQAFRSTTAIMATGLRADFALSAQALGVLAGAFAFAFGAMQLFIGIAIDLYGVGRTLLAVSPLTLAGALLSALAPGYGVVLFGQVLIGVGCAPAFLVCAVFIARHFEPARFAAISGVVMGISGLGLLLTGTPLAWLVQQSSWRLGFGLLAALAALAWLLVWRQVPEAAQPPPAAAARAPVRDAVRGLGALFLLPHTAGIMLLALTTYASFLSLRGLWLGPLLIERHGYSLLASGHVALFASLISLFSPACFGRLDPGPATRRRWLVGCTLLLAALFAAIGLVQRERVEGGGADGGGAAVGLHGAAICGRALGLPGGTDRARDGGVHDGAVPGGGADAVGDGHRRLAGRRPGDRALCGGDADHCADAGLGGAGIQMPAGAGPLTPGAGASPLAIAPHQRRTAMPRPAPRGLAWTTVYSP